MSHNDKQQNHKIRFILFENRMNAGKTKLLKTDNFFNKNKIQNTNSF